MSKKIKSENKLAFLVNQKGFFLSSTEKEVINYIGSFSDDLHKTQKEISIDLGLSISTFQRAIKKLLGFGLITRRYWHFKHAIYKLVDVASQISIVKNIAANGIQTARNFRDKLRDKFRKRSMKSNDLSPMKDLVMSWVKDSNKENILKENNLLNIDKKQNIENKRFAMLQFLLKDKAQMMTN